MSEEHHALDWREAHARLERTRAALEAGEEIPPEEARRILAERARAFAKPTEEAPPPTEVLDLLVFSLAGERYGIDVARVLEVSPLRGIVPVPGTPPFVLGIVNRQGRIFPVLDLRRVFELAGHGVTEESRVLAVEAGGLAFGVLAEAVAGVVRVGAREIEPRPTALASGHHAFVLAVTRDMVGVVDLEALARDPRITVNEEIG
jgi:purine-binding chemotaxis protein CheW